jgi:hypothetical protein
MPQAVTIGSLARAFDVVKGMQAQGLEWGENYRPLGRQALTGILQSQMGHAIDEHLDRVATLDVADQRNGSYARHLLVREGELALRRGFLQGQQPLVLGQQAVALPHVAHAARGDLDATQYQLLGDTPYHPVQQSRTSSLAGSSNLLILIRRRVA